MSNRRVLSFTFAIAMALIGCTGATPVAPSQDRVTPAPVTPTVGPSPVAPTSIGDDDAPRQVPALEAMLPSNVLGVAVRKASLSGEQAIEEMDVVDPVIDAITLMGRSPSEIEVALGAPEDESFVVTAIRMPGMDAQTMRATIVAANDPDELEVREGQIAGKTVSSLGDRQFFYATRDILFSVFGEINVANEITSRLP
jgi:hypothetical protein